MRALLLKDWYLLLRQSRIFLLLIVLFALMPGASMTGFAVVYAAMLPYTAIAYDERSKWDIYAAMMPYSRTALVAEKYLLGWLAIGGAGVLAMAGKAITMLFGSQNNAEGFLSVVSIIGVALLMLAFTLPLVFRYGVEKGRMLFMAVLVIGVLLGISGFGVAGDAAADSRLLNGLIVVGLPLVGLIAQPISLLLSQRMYYKVHIGS